MHSNYLNKEILSAIIQISRLAQNHTDRKPFRKCITLPFTLAGQGNDSFPLDIPWTPSKTTLGELVYISLLIFSLEHASRMFWVPVRHVYRISKRVNAAAVVKNQMHTRNNQKTLTFANVHNAQKTNLVR